MGHTDPTKRTRWNKWTSKRIGPKRPETVWRTDIEDIRDDLDTAITAWKKDGAGEGRVSGKTAMNAWSALTSSFKLMTSSKRRDLRVLDGKPNPCIGVEPPGDRNTRRARRKPFIYPKEAAVVFACSEVPREWREVHAIAAYTYLRPGELRVLTVGDVDLAAGVINLTKAWDHSADQRVNCEPSPAHQKRKGTGFSRASEREKGFEPSTSTLAGGTRAWEASAKRGNATVSRAMSRRGGRRSFRSGERFW